MIELLLKSKKFPLWGLENFVSPDKVDTTLLDSTIENLNRLLDDNQKIEFINTSVIIEFLKMCEKFFTEE